MLWQTIKQILQKNPGACIIVEDGQPTLVITRFEEYQKILESQPFQRFKSDLTEQEVLEKINQEIASWKAQQAESSTEAAVAEESEEVKIENLPIV